MLCSNRTSSCDFLAERPSRAGRLSEFRFFGENSRGDFAGVAPRLLPAPSPRLRHFATLFPMAKHRVPDRATDHLVRRSRSSSTSLRSSTRQGLGAWIASTLFQTALFTANTGARGRCLDIDYCTISPCSARSRPSRSMSCVTRRPTTFLTTKRMIKLATAS
jgi:hypothetical protein